ncbi:MAG TPA: 50S ribosomal protein L23 [Thioalkalivibrio sp.]|nr:50S ribosomal protein L23 [Thioalkalivibrio sp.]
MNQERIFQVLVGPHVSEKAAMVADAAQQHVFKVSVGANKLEIKRAVEKLFNVKVTDVRVVNMKGKNKRFGQMQGRRKDWKKAYVTLAEGQDIDFTGAE